MEVAFLLFGLHPPKGKLQDIQCEFVLFFFLFVSLSFLLFTSFHCFQPPFHVLQSKKENEFVGISLIEQHYQYVWAATSLHGTRVIIFSANTMELLGSFEAHKSRITQIVSLKNYQIWTASVDEIRIWECLVSSIIIFLCFLVNLRLLLFINRILLSCNALK